MPIICMAPSSSYSPSLPSSDSPSLLPTLSSFTVEMWSLSIPPKIRCVRISPAGRKDFCKKRFPQTDRPQDRPFGRSERALCRPAVSNVRMSASSNDLRAGSGHRCGARPSVSSNWYRPCMGMPSARRVSLPCRKIPGDASSPGKWK